MNKKLGIVLAIVLLLTGCQLARADISTETDRLVGIFISREDFEFSERSGERVTGLPKYDDDNLLIDIEFPDTPGHLMLYNRFTDTVNNEPSEVHSALGGYMYVHVEGMNPTTKTDVKIEETIYFPKGSSSLTNAYYVYQRPSGEWYLVLSRINPHITSDDGYSATNTFSETVTGTGLTPIEESLAFVYHLKPYDMSESITLLTFNKSHRLIEELNYSVETKPEEITLPSETDYVLIERLPDADQPLIREIIDRQTGSIDWPVLQPSGFIKMEPVTLIFQ